jgi:hypothetical protein
VNPDLYLPCFIRLRLKVLHRPGFASYDPPLSFHAGKTEKTYAFLTETLAYEDMLDAKKRQDYLSPKVVIERFHPTAAAHLHAPSASQTMRVAPPQPQAHSYQTQAQTQVYAQQVHPQQRVLAPQPHQQTQQPQQSFPKAFIAPTNSAPQLSQHLSPPVPQHIVHTAVIPAPIQPITLAPSVALVSAPVVAQPPVQAPATDALEALANSAALLPTESVEIAPIHGNGMSS